MKAENSALADQIGHKLASQFHGGNASAHVEDISLLSTDQQVPVRQAYFRALRIVWIMLRGTASFGLADSSKQAPFDLCSSTNNSMQYVAFAALTFMLNFFVSEHHLSDERKAVVLGIDRGQPFPPQQPSQGEAIQLETSGRQHNDSQQQTLRNRAT
ncbi:plays a role in the entry into g0 [Colletotrichum incanum]|uniref:Plays a role in the entry into g0 n=1 Tax=Colletotrichum incanum TaxID=1573173 RepID=A0A166LS16_COLIC|nr:plays a role in the entry into g0 [Colletotrichum incanum]